MNRKQVNFILTGLFLIFLCSVLPPRRYKNAAGPASRGFLLSTRVNISTEPSGMPDEVTEIVDSKGKVVSRATRPSYTTVPVEIDIARLLAEWGVILAITGFCVVWVWRENLPDP